MTLTGSGGTGVSAATWMAASAVGGRTHVRRRPADVLCRGDLGLFPGRDLRAAAAELRVFRPELVQLPLVLLLEVPDVRHEVDELVLQVPDTFALGRTLPPSAFRHQGRGAGGWVCWRGRTGSGGGSVAGRGTTSSPAGCGGGSGPSREAPVHACRAPVLTPCTKYLPAVSVAAPTAPAAVPSNSLDRAPISPSPRAAAAWVRRASSADLECSKHLSQNGSCITEMTHWLWTAFPQ